jgi:hypothetical protein
MSESNSRGTQNDSEEKNIFEDYRKTCSAIFGKASQSQLKYIQAFSDFQQAVWASCDSMVAKQISALEEYSKSNHNAAHLELPLRIYSSIIDVYMKWVSASCDLGVTRLQFYRSNVERFNDMVSQSFSFNK